MYSEPVAEHLKELGEKIGHHLELTFSSFGNAGTGKLCTVVVKIHEAREFSGQGHGEDPDQARIAAIDIAVAKYTNLASMEKVS